MERYAAIATACHNGMVYQHARLGQPRVPPLPPPEPCDAPLPPLLRGERRDHHIAEEHLADAIELLMQRRDRLSISTGA